MTDAAQQDAGQQDAGHHDAGQHVAASRAADALPVRAVGTDEEALRCWPVLRELRPHVDDQGDFLRRWRTQASEGYQLVYVESAGQVVAVAGYRVLTTMAWGRIVYIDDLVALPVVHGGGFGALLLRHIKSVAAELGCDAVHLDTGYQRHAAHLSYLRNGFELVCHHMSWTP